MQSTSCKMPGWMNYKLESRLPGETSTISDMQTILLYWLKVKRNSWWGWESEEAGLKLNIQKTKIMVSSPINLWQVEWKKCTSDRFSFLVLQNDCSDVIKRHLLLGRKAMTNLGRVLERRDIILPTRIQIVKAMTFLVVTYGCELDHKEGWALKNWCFQTMAQEKTLESPLDCKNIKPVHPKGNQSWIFIGRTVAEAEALILWLPELKNWLIGKDPDAGKDWRQEEKGTTEDEMVGWHHLLNGHEFEQALGVGDGQGSLECCSPCSRRVGHDLATEQQQLPSISHSPALSEGSSEDLIVFQIGLSCRSVFWGPEWDMHHLSVRSTDTRAPCLAWRMSWHVTGIQWEQGFLSWSSVFILWTKQNSMK